MNLKHISWIIIAFGWVWLIMYKLPDFEPKYLPKKVQGKLAIGHFALAMIIFFVFLYTEYKLYKKENNG